MLVKPNRHGPFSKLFSVFSGVKPAIWTEFQFRVLMEEFKPIWIFHEGGWNNGGDFPPIKV